MSGRPISVSLTFDIHWQAPDHKTGWSRGCTSHLTSCPRLTYLHWRAQVWAVKTFMKLCLLEQPQHYSDKSLRSIIHIRAHTALSITTQNTVRSQEWNSAKWIPLSPDRMKLSHDVGLRTHSFKVMIWKRNPCCHETRDLVANRFYWCCCHWWRTRNQGRADTFYITSIQIPSLQRWQRGDIACNAHIKCQGNQCFAFWLLWLQIHLIMALVMSRSAAWGELVHIKEYLVISRIEHSTNVKLFLLWASEIPAKYFSIFDYSRLRENYSLVGHSLCDSLLESFIL